MNRRAVLFVAAMLAVGAGSLGAQVLPVRLYGDSLSERAYALVQAPDSGFCLAGWTTSYGPGAPGASNVLVVQTDAAGLPVWARVSAGANDEEAHSMVKTRDGGYALAGWTSSYGVGAPAANVFVIKLSAAGNVLWGTVYGGPMDDMAYSITETADSGFAVCGLTASFGPNPVPNIFVLKLSSRGVVQWWRTYWLAASQFADEAYGITQTADSGFAVVGYMNAFGPAQFDPFLLKLGAAGNVQWCQVVPGTQDNDEAYSVTSDLEGHILVAGWTRSFGTNPGVSADMLVAKFGMNGALQWSRTYGWAAGDEEAIGDRALVATADGGCAVCGPTTSVGPGVPNPNFMVMKLDPNCFPMWTRSHPSPYNPGLGDDVPLAMVELAGGGYAVAGWTNSFPQKLGGDDFMLSTFDAMGNRPVCSEVQEPYLDSTPWIAVPVADSYDVPDIDSMPMETVSVRVDSVCYDTTPTGLRGRSGFVPRPRPLALETRGARVELVLARPLVVEAKLFAADGREVRVLSRGRLESGRHRLAIPENITAGTYLVWASSGTSRASAKLVKPR